MTESHPLAGRPELTVADVLAETFPGIVDWCDPVWLGYWGLDTYRGAPARRTDDGAVTPEEVASVIVFLASAVNTTINGEVVRANGGAFA